MSAARLVAALGSEIVFAHEPRSVEGAKLEATLRPPSGEALGETLHVLAAEGLPALVRGGGSRLATANAPCRARVLLETAALQFEPELDAEEGVMRCAAGSRLAALRESLSASGWELPLDPPGRDATLGGVLAAAAPGPCFALPRDAVLGLGVALAGGERVRCGGRVVKNVTGYDLAKLFTGSFGAFGVIEWAWLRLRPAPQATRLCVVPLGFEPEADALALAAARRPSVRAAALVDRRLLGEAAPGADGRHLVLELAGDAAAVSADTEVLARESGARDAEPALLARVREVQDGGPVRVRIDALPTELPAVTAALREGGGQVLAHPARGLAWGFFPLEGPEDEVGADRAFQAATRAAAAASGARRIEAAPVGARQGREVFGDPGTSLALERALKQQYDPAGILNPGRFVGGL